MPSPSGPVNRKQPAPKQPPVNKAPVKKAPVKKAQPPTSAPAAAPHTRVQQPVTQPLVKPDAKKPSTPDLQQKTGVSNASSDHSFRSAKGQLPSVDNPSVALTKAQVEKTALSSTGTSTATRLASSGGSGNASGPAGGSKLASEQSADAARTKAATDLGLNANATQAQIDAARSRLVNFTPDSPLALADAQDRAAVNNRIAELKQKNLDLAAKVSLLEMDPSKRKPEEVVADRYRIDTRGKTSDQLRQETALRVAQLSGVDPNQLKNMSTADLEAANRQRSLDWLATLPNSGIKADAADPNFKNVTNEQMLQGYRNIYGLPKEATWGDIQQSWMNTARNNNPDLLKAAGMDRGQSEYFHYRQTSGLADLEKAVNPNAPSGQIYVLDGATFKTPDGKPVLGADGKPVGYDLNNDGRVDVSHSRIVTELMNDAIPQDRITVMNTSTLDGLYVDDNKLRENLNNLATLSKTPGNVAAVNLSVQPYAVNGDPNTPNGSNLTFQYLSDTLGIPGLTADNIVGQREAVKQKINEIAQAYQSGTRTDPRAQEVVGWRDTINSLEGVTANKVPVYLAAGNQGPDAFNVYGLANGVTMVGATDPTVAGSNGTPVIADYSGKNPLIARNTSGYVTYTDTGTNAIDPDGKVTLNERTAGRTGVDLNWDGRADFFLRDLSDNGGAVKPLDQNQYVSGTSFATPRTLVEDFQRGVFRVD